MNKVCDISKINDLLFDGMSIAVGGFMVNGTSEAVIDKIVESNVQNITIICNDGGYPDRGVGKLIASGQATKLIASHIGLNPLAGQKMASGDLEVELVPQGTLAERIRCGGNGIPAFYTATGVGTMVAEGKESKVFDNVEYILETAIKADLAVVRGSVVDEKGNMTYNKTTRNFNPLVAMAAEVVVAGAEKIVKVGEIQPENVVTPHIFVDYIVKEV